MGARAVRGVFGQTLSVDVLEGHQSPHGRRRRNVFWQRCRSPRPKKKANYWCSPRDGKGVPLVKKDAQQVPVFEEKNRGPAIAAWPRWPASTRWIAMCVPRSKSWRPCCVTTPSSNRRTVPSRASSVIVAALPSQAPDGADAVPSAYGPSPGPPTKRARRWRPGQPVIRLMDGQKSLWDAADACLEEWIAKLHETKACLVVDILDIIHVSSYLWRAAKVLYGAKEHREAFVQDRMLRILQGDVRGVVTGMRRMASQRELKGKDLKEMNTVCNSSWREVSVSLDHYRPVPAPGFSATGRPARCQDTLSTSLACFTTTEQENAVFGTPWPNCADSN